MNHKFVIFAPHMDDEFIGCNRFIEKYHNQIDKIIYFTDSSLSSDFLGKSTMLNILTRQSESMKYLNSISFGLEEKAICLNIPDGLTAEECIRKCHMNTSIKEFSNKLLNTTSKMCKDSIILFPMLDTNHISHIWCYQHCTVLAKKFNLKTIQYQCHELLMGNNKIVAATSTKKLKNNKWNIDHTYYGDIKNNKFEKYFNTQYLDFKKQNIELSNWERYYSDIELSLH